MPYDSYFSFSFSSLSSLTMRSLYYNHHFSLLDRFSLTNRRSLPPSNSFHRFKLNLSNARKRGFRLQHRNVQVGAFDDDFGVSFDDWTDNEASAAAGAYLISSSDDDSDGDYMLNPVSDIDLPSSSVSSHDSLTVTAHRLAIIAKERRKHRMRLGIFNNMGLIGFAMLLLFFVDWCAWKIVRLPLSPLHLSRPFLTSIALASIAGYVSVPFLNTMKIHQVISEKRRPDRHFKKRQTPTMGGLFFIPIGVGVAIFLAGFSSVEVYGAAVATLAFAAIGLLDDILSLTKNHHKGLPSWTKLLLEAAVGTLFALWLDATSISSPYSMKMLIPLPGQLGLVCLGKCYLLLTSFCFVSMGSGIDLTDSLDGLAGGTAALALIGMSIAVLPICPELAIFGSSMAGACVGFLLHNRYKASVFMGDTGSLALGGALASMAACSGMFFPLFISSGFIFLEASSVIMQVAYFKATKRLKGIGQRLFRMTPFHHHLELCGFKEPRIVAGAYAASCLLALIAGYVGLISA
ncbi:phospho-N-acetylmuramoyl-pentapeptide-transferase homolog [Mercurialis annua]|uniref:phospho-N-acetylmuramoyl-pentapeptide- transferase homolog n=1 Tax=Mercurialis annua TaxID=3986 RepID=UPI00215F3455|nr:phospho-N-acetylmuramoyl-pentapeptide-transferase homolog [Mercurialis annua]